VNDVMIHPNQAEVISCDQHGSVRIWDLAANACSHELVPEEDAQMKSISVASDGSLLTAGTHKGNVYLWRMISTKAAMLMPATQTTQLKPALGSLQPALSNPNLISSTPIDPQSLTWDLQPVTKIAAHQNYMLRHVLSPDVKHLATASADTTIRLWSIQSPAKQNMPDEAPSSHATHANAYNVSLDKTLTGHQRWVWDCAWSADSEYLVSASSDQTAKLWDRRSGEAIRTYQGHHKAAVCVALNDVNI
jgi:target of rapamycin complex subunit LST8